MPLLAVAFVSLPVAAGVRAAVRYEKETFFMSDTPNENDNNANDDNAHKDDANVVKGFVDYNGKVYPLDTLKEGLTLIGVSLASNVKERGVANALGKLTEEQAQKLAEYLNENDNNITE